MATMFQGHTFYYRLFLLLALSLLGACDRSGPQEEPIIRPVRFEYAAMRGGAETRTFSGTTQAEVESTLSFKVPGTVTRLDVNVGDVVSPGQTVAELDPTDYRVSYQEAEAGLAAAEAEFRNAESNYNRVRDLYENRNASTGDLDSARAAWESAAAQVRAARQQREAARLQLSYTRLNAPQECTVADKYVKENENVSTGQGIVHVVCGECSEVSVAMPGPYIGRVQPGSEVTVTIDAIPDSVFPAIVTEIGVASGMSGATFPTTVTLKEPCPELRSGMAADVAFGFAPQTDRPHLFVPGLSVGEDRNGRYVFVLERADGDVWIARKRPVEIGEVYPDGVEIIQGLSEGDPVVTAGVRRVIDGQRVRLLEN